MKQFVAIFFVALAVYAAWVMTPRAARSQFRKAVARHVLPVTVIAVILIAALVLAFYLPSANLL